MAALEAVLEAVFGVVKAPQETLDVEVLGALL